MRFFWPEPTPHLTAADQQRWEQTFATVTFACTECGAEDTVETDQLTPAGMSHMVRCPEGHVTVGVPPRKYRREP